MRAAAAAAPALWLPLIATVALAIPHDTSTASTDTIITLGNDTILVGNDTLIVGNETYILGNDTVIESDGVHEPIIRKKRTFGDIVFRGLADVLGYNVARKPPQPVFPPPLAPVPGIDTPLQVSLVPLQPAQTQAAQAPAPCGVLQLQVPCGLARALAQPCLGQQQQAQPCPKPRAQALQPAAQPCGRAPANQAAAAPCGPAGQQDQNLESISSNFQLNFNINRNRPTAAPAANEALEQPAPVTIAPRAARLPPPQPRRKPRVYVDAFVVRDGITQRVDTVDADNFQPRRGPADDDFVSYDDEEDSPPPSNDYYEDVQESRDKAVRDFSTAVDKFWDKKKKKRGKKWKQPKNDYQSVHFGDREYAEQLRHRNDNSHERLRAARPPQLPQPEAEEEGEGTTSTEDPRRSLRPRILPPTEQNPGQIDTVTVRVPPIYREKRPRKLNRAPDRDEEGRDEGEGYYEREHYTEPDSEPPAPRLRRRRKQNNRYRRSVEGDDDRTTKNESRPAEINEEEDPFSVVDFDYFGKKIPVSDEEKFYRELRLPDPTRDPDVERVESGKGADNPYLDDHERLREEKRPLNEGDDFLDDHERLREDPERTDEQERTDNSGQTDDSGRTDDSGKTDDSGRSTKNERIKEDPERADDDRQRADSSERSDRLSPNAHVHETGYRNKILRATNVRVHDPNAPQRAARAHARARNP